jgi:phosphatidylinositol glycan class K
LFITRIIPSLHRTQYENDNDIGVAVIDRYTHYMLEFLEGINKTSHETVADMVRASIPPPSLYSTKHPQFATYDPVKIASNPGVRTDLFPRALTSTLLTDFFGGVAHAEVSEPGSAHSPTYSPAEESIPQPEGAVNEAPPRLNYSYAEPVSERWRGPATEQWRAWGGVALLGLLVGWVSLR